MAVVERYLTELADELHVRGAARRRFLRECRDHLVDAAGEHGAERAVRDFGDASEIAAAFDAEVVARRGVRSTYATAAAVVATGGSTLALIHASSPTGAAPTAWAIAFFVAAQVAAVAAAVGLLQALVLRRVTMAPADALLLARRNACAIVSAGIAMFAAAAALPGRGSAAVILTGPALACAATISVLRARRLARRLAGSSAPGVRPPLEDLAQLLPIPVPAIDARRLLALITVGGAAAAFLRDRAERGSVGEALVTAGIEATAIAACFFVLGGALGLRARWRAASRLGD